MSQWGAQCRTNPLGRENISEERFLEPAFRPAKPGLIAQQGSHLRWPRDRMSYSFSLPCGSDWVETRRRESFPVEPFLSQWRPRPLSTAADAAQMGRAFCKQDSGDAEESDRPRICLGADRQHHLSLSGTGSVDPEVGPVFDYTGHRRFAAASRCEATTRQIHFWIQAKASSCMFGGKEWPTS